MRNQTNTRAEPEEVRAGAPLPLGTQVRRRGVNFAIFSRNALRVCLEFFDHPEDAAPARLIDLDSLRNRTGDGWHVWVKGTSPGQLYAYRLSARSSAILLARRSNGESRRKASQRGQ